MSIAIKLPRFTVRFFLKTLGILSRPNIIIVCKGYGEDWEYYTELGWDEGEDLEVESYEDYQIWVTI